MMMYSMSAPPHTEPPQMKFHLATALITGIKIPIKTTMCTGYYKTLIRRLSAY